MKLIQCQDGLVCMCKELLKELRMNIKFSHVKSHADKDIPYEHFNLAQRLNVDVDKLENHSLLRSLIIHRYIKSYFPFTIT